MTDAIATAVTEALRAFSLTGQGAIVTGAGRGIGRGIAHLFAATGAHVLVADLARDSAEMVAAEIAAAGGRAHPFAGDVSQEADVVAMIQAGAALTGRLDVIVNNAGIFPKYLFTELTVAAWDEIQAVNLRGVFLCMREAIKSMRADGRGGAIVNISSVSSLQAAVFCNQAYGASKAGVSNLTKSCAVEFAPDKIRVNAVLPGGVMTEGARAATSAPNLKGQKLDGPLTNPARMPLGRPATPDDIARAALFLASPASAYITGQLLAVDGGFMVS
ncbi:MAG TPA: SDR family NAD(P)-dependent oxidoreductase [Acetobacteraceae bacterium]|nr:SDR family NAD(P)-dependent oxidoreductase [Acetobacteraceae bacterium]